MIQRMKLKNKKNIYYLINKQDNSGNRLNMVRISKIEGGEERKEIRLAELKGQRPNAKSAL